MILNSDVMTRSNILAILMLAILICLTCYSLWFKPSTDSSTAIRDLEASNRQYEQFVFKLLKQSDSLYKINVVLGEKYDSLDSAKTNVKIKYHEIYVYIKSANNQQLDSIIRTNW